MVTFFKFSLLAIFPLACYTVWYTSLTDGSFKLINEEVIPKGELPGAPNIRFKERYTGIYALDQTIIGIVVYYWSAVSGESPSMILHFIANAGALGSIWILALLEACRTQGFPRWIRRMTTVMTATIMAGHGVVFPVYFALGLNAEPQKGEEEDMALTNLIFIERLRRYMTLSYILPTVLMLLPAPKLISFDLKQQSIAVFQITYILLAANVIATWLWHRQDSKHVSQSQVTLAAKQRSTYKFALALSAVTHIVAVIPSLAVTLGLPPFYPDDGYADFPSLFFPPLRWTPSSVSDSVFRPLQWDHLWASLSVLLWGIALHVQCMQRVKKAVSYSRLLVKVAVLSVIIGAPGAAAVLLLERNGMMVKQGSDQEKRD